MLQHLIAAWKGVDDANGGYERLRSASKTNLALQAAGGSLLVATPGEWTSVHGPTTATKATITKAAGAAGICHVCTGIFATIACDSTAQTPLNVYLRDGATGAGTIIWAGSVSAPANGLGGIAITGLSIMGTAATAMTLEFSAAGVTGSLEAVTLVGYDVA